MTAKFVVGGTLVTAELPDGISLPEAESLRVKSDDESWMVTEEQLSTSYEPVSDTATHFYRAIVE